MMDAQRSGLAARWRLTRTGLALGGAAAAVILLTWWGSFFIQTQLRLNDSYFIPTPVSGTVVLIALDDASHAQYGRSVADWPRRLYANLVAIVSRAGARVVAFDVLFSEPSSDDTALVTAIRAARESQQRTRVVMPFIGLQPTPADTTPVLRFDDLLPPIDRLSSVADYLGSVNTFSDTDNTVRRQPSRVQVGDTTYLSLSLATYLAYLRVPAAASPQVITAAADSVTVAERRLPVDANGLWRPYFFGPPAAFPTYSARAVLAGEVPAAAFEDKIVLIGLMNHTGGTDVYLTPTSSAGQMMAGVEIHANAIESLLQARFITEHSRTVQMIMIIGLALVAGSLYINLKWYWIFPAVGVLMLLAVIAASLRFETTFEITNLFHALLALALPAGLVLAYDISTENTRRRKAEFLLQSVVQVSNQRLIIDRILPLLAADIQRVTGAASGGIWLADDATGTLALRYQWQPATGKAPDFSAASQHARGERRLVEMAGVAAHPVIWQQHMLGVIAIQQPARRFSRWSALRLFSLLTEQAAPTLESAILYTQTQQQAHLLATVLAGSPAAVAVTDGNLSITTANTAFDSVFPLRAGCPHADLLQIMAAADIPPEVQDVVRKHLPARRPFRHELTLGKRSFTLDAAPLDFGGWVVILNDVSTLVELSTLKTQMLRIASHDLKKPLSRIVGYGSLILDTPEKDTLSATQLQYIERITQAGEEMAQIINQILMMEQLRSRRLQRALVDMSSIVTEAVTRYYAEAHAKRQTLTAQIADNLPRVSGDSYLLHQIVANLVDNAIKYTPDGGAVTVRLKADDTMIRLEVEDTGLGIPEFALERVFEDFYRVRSPETQQINGTGLGLGLAKSLVTAHDGRIWVQSIEKVGSTFYVELPAAEA